MYLFVDGYGIIYYSWLQVKGSMMTYTNSIRNTTKLSQSIYTSRVETWYTVSSLLLLLLAVAAHYCCCCCYCYYCCLLFLTVMLPCLLIEHIMYSSRISSLIATDVNRSLSERAFWDHRAIFFCQQKSNVNFSLQSSFFGRLSTQPFQVKYFASHWYKSYIQKQYYHCYYYYYYIRKKTQFHSKNIFPVMIKL